MSNPFLAAIGRHDNGAVDLHMSMVGQILISALHGVWSVDRKPTGFVTLNRSDGLRLVMLHATGPDGRVPAIELHMGDYRSASGDMIPLTPIARAVGLAELPRARVRLDKRTLGDIADDITRRVILPAARMMPLIEARYTASGDMEHARRETIDLLRKAGANVEGLQSRQTALVTLGDITLRVRDDGGLAFNALNVAPQHVGETVRLLAKVCYGPSPENTPEEAQ